MAKRRRRNTSHGNGITTLVEAHVAQLVEALTVAVREQIAAEAAAFFGSGRSGRPAPKIASKPRGKRRILGCIAPGCKNTSKGPRFHYLCDKHKDAPKKDYEAWRQASHAKGKGATPS